MRLLPSYQAARSGSPVRVAQTYLARALLISAGLCLAGDKNLVRNSLAASGAIQAYVLYWAYKHRN